MHKSLKEAKKHLREDRATWLKLSKMAKKEAMADAKLLKRLK